MRGTILYGPRDIRFEERPDPKILQPTDAILRISATCICGSDLWPYRGIAAVAQPTAWATSTAAWWKKSGAR
jgi:threonine dehydrogenase-like Zn-dependent dehydrogenase